MTPYGSPPKFRPVSCPQCGSTLALGTFHEDDQSFAGRVICPDCDPCEFWPPTFSLRPLTDTINTKKTMTKNRPFHERIALRFHTFAARYLSPFVLALVVFAVPGCSLFGGGSPATATRDTLAAITAVANPIYAELVNQCDEAEGRLVAVSSGETEFRALVTPVRVACTKAAEAFETARAAQIAAYSAADAIAACPAQPTGGECLASAVGALRQAAEAWEVARGAFAGAKQEIETAGGAQ